jgi:hypothetical protein
MSTNQPPAGERPNLDYQGISANYGLPGTAAAQDRKKGNLKADNRFQDNSASESHRGAKPFDDSIPGGTILSPGLQRKADLNTQTN